VDAGGDVSLPWRRPAAQEASVSKQAAGVGNKETLVDKFLYPHIWGEYRMRGLVMLLPQRARRDTTGGRGARGA
jgi:hypothetical protein